MIKNTLFLLLLFWLSPLCSESVTTWSSPDGHTFEGTFVRMQGPSVVLKGTDGGEVIVPLVRLSPDSQKQAAEAHQEALKHQPVYTHRNRFLRFELHPEHEWLKLQFLEGDRVVNNDTYTVNFTLFEVRPSNRWSQSRFKEMLGPPEESRSDVSIRFLMENGVKLKFTVDRNDKADLSFRVEALEVPQGLPPLDLRTSIAFPELLKYDMKTTSYIGELSREGVPFKKLPEFFKGYEIRMDAKDGKSERIAYHEKKSGNFSGPSFAIKAPGKKDLVLEGPRNEEDGILRLWFYNGKAPFEGYRIRFHSRERDVLEAGPFSIGVR